IDGNDPRDCHGHPPDPGRNPGPYKSERSLHANRTGPLPPAASKMNQVSAQFVGGPCRGLTVVEVAVGVSDLGLGMAAGVPGMLMANLGADVVRIVGSTT